MEWTVGRAGMLYADLLPDQAGGRVLVHRIRIPECGPAGDWVHYHEVGVQLILVLAGRVRLVYEDQGPAFWAEPGDVVVQPPTIRHEVLETESGLEVLELVAPADHTTHADPELVLPTPQVRPDRVFGGQRFLWDRERPEAWRACGAWDHRATAVEAATGGCATVQMWRANGAAEIERGACGGVRLWFAVSGPVHVDGGPVAPGAVVRSEAAAVVQMAPGATLYELGIAERGHPGGANTHAG